jgi:hypothetical protein
VTGLLGCTAEGTDFEALPIVSIDKTEPHASHTTLPIVLSAYDTGPPHRIVRGPKGGPIDQKAPPDQGASKLQLLFPIFSYEGEGREHETRLFASFMSPLGGLFTASTGPAGRALGPADVADQPITHPLLPGAATPVSGGYYLFPLEGYDRVHLDPTQSISHQGTKRDFGFFPLFMGGDWPDQGRYFALAPFGGVTYGFLGRDEMDWWGFPYPFYLYSRERDVESRHILFPFVNWVEGGGRTGFRIWPFYAHYARTDLIGRPRYDRHWIMWPLVSWGTNYSPSGGEDEELGAPAAPIPTEELFIFPFYGRIVGPETINTTVLWPLFRYEENPAANFWELRAPFPIVTIHHGNDPELVKAGKNGERWRFDIWPLFGVKTRPGYIRHFVGWPIERYEARDDQWVKDTKFYFLPLFSVHHHVEKETNEDYVRWRVWPLVQYRRGVKGDIELHALAPILWDDPNGAERIIFPFFRLYEYKRTSEGGHQHRFLFGLASWRDEPAVPGLTDGYDRLSVLFGLFQIRKGGTNAEESPKHGVRLFYLPEITWGGL